MGIKRHWKSAAVVTLFFAALWTPLIAMFFGVGNFKPGEEGRTLAAPPHLGRGNWFAFGAAFTAYFHDHFGFRGTLITAQAWLKVKALGVSSSADVVLGKDGWLFYAGDKSMENHRGVLPFTGDELERWVQLFKKRGDWLARRGIPMMVAIVPDKLSVYPEFLPQSFRKLRDHTRLDVFASAVSVLDLRPALLAAKREGFLLYSPTDTHWTARGAYTGYVAIVQEIRKKYPDIQPIRYPGMPTGKARSGDLAKMLGLGRAWREVPEDPPWPPELRTSETPEGDLLIEHAAGTNRRLVMFGDSFSPPLMPYLAQHFEQTILSRSSAFKPEIIAKSHPDMVLFEMAERMLNIAVPRDPW